MWGSQNDKFQEKYPRNQIVGFDPQAAKIVKKTDTHKMEKNSIINI